MSVFFYGCITLDGYLADKNHNLDWLYQTGDAEETDYESFYNSMDITIMGKRTFNEIEKMDNTETIYPTTENYVITHAKNLSIQGFIPVNSDIIEFVKQIDKDKNIWIVGGSTIMAPLLDHDMIDNIIIQIAPVLLGAGIPLFAQKEALKRFFLKEVKQYGQFAELVYSKYISGSWKMRSGGKWAETTKLFFEKS
ncbi:dihydrofolate reductase family protein [Clostridium boliviensis]|uniref:Dihydrofolate reductase family protein n=1 Tax=Clostridium boliviensis TaxID=318465 RepID=A0ABU4GT27_9CLOT|nr:dihydrofolate reductase family protein [Clostridium boliviensis]MDW2800800.1 dihydrofolate reductase family protein [Clostridium boliviensis]